MYRKLDRIINNVTVPDGQTNEYETNLSVFTLKPKCPTGFVDIDSVQKLPFCYKIVHEQLSWKNASAECNRLDAILSTISTTEENLYMSEAFKKTGITLSWIGLKKSGKIGPGFL